MPRFSLRVLATVVAGLAISLGLMRNPYPHVAYGVGAFVLAVMSLAAVMAIGCRQPARSFCFGFVFATLVVLWNSIPETEPAWGLPKVAHDAAVWVDDAIDWSTPTAPESGSWIENDYLVTRMVDEQGNPGGRSMKRVEDATDAELEQAVLLPSREAFRSIFVYLTAVLVGLLGGWIAWAARRQALRSDATR